MAGRYEKSFCVSKYYDGNIRIFSMVNIPENENLFKLNVIRSSDVFLILLCWQHDQRWFEEASNVLNQYNLNKNNFFIMCNTKKQLELASQCGFKNCHFINRHFNLDYNYYKTDTNCFKKFDVCIFGEQMKRNRIPLSFNLKKLAILDGNSNWNETWNYPETAWRNEIAVGTNGMIIQETMRQSWCGLCISEAESMCWSSLEFFFNGIPVITTYNDTGRMEWYNTFNSIIISENDLTNNLQQIVDSFVNDIRSGKYDALKIRELAIEQSNFFRNNFINMVASILNDKIKSELLFREKFEQRMLYEKHWKSLEKTVELLR
jgi:hypothetical protein